MKIKFALLCFAFLIPAGCSKNTEPIPGLTKTGIDTTTANLPPEHQKIQDKLRRVLNAFQEGVADQSDLRLLVGLVDFQDDVPGFYSGHKRLYRWDFEGAPTDDVQAVKLIFDESSFGALDSKSKTEEVRKYRVVDNGNGHSISVIR